MYEESAMLCATPSLSGSSGFLVGGQRVAGSSIQGSAQNRANLYAKRFRVTSIGSTEHWDRIGQFFAAFASGQTTASVALKRLVGHGPKNRFYRATRELGRVFKTEFILDYLSQPARFARGSDAGSSRENSYTPSPGASTTADWADWISATSNAKPARRGRCRDSQAPRLGLGADHPVNAKNGGTMPSKTKNPLAEAMRELKADPTPAARPVVRTTLAGKAKPTRGEDTRIIAGHFGRRSSPATPCTGRPGEEHGPRTAAGSLERPVPETQSPTDCLMLAVL